jgi:hypothetical protein
MNKYFQLNVSVSVRRSEAKDSETQKTLFKGMKSGRHIPDYFSLVISFRGTNLPAGFTFASSARLIHT